MTQSYTNPIDELIKEIKLVFSKYTSELIIIKVVAEVKSPDTDTIDIIILREPVTPDLVFSDCIGGHIHVHDEKEFIESLEKLLNDIDIERILTLRTIIL